ncbi:MAG: hypothetical protein PHX08_20510 [Lachnospiraceae bacterium]|nr:hypothetical protein [Lachnospiraceae bacterium]
MATQKQIKEWLPNAIKIFQTYIPMPTPPEIHIVNKRTLVKKRTELVTRLHSHQINFDPQKYDSIMEEIHIELGDAIIIQHQLIVPPSKDYRAEEFFQHFI